MDVTAEDARRQLDHLLDLASSGVEVVVTREGKSPVLLVPGDRPKSKPIPLDGRELRDAIERIVGAADMAGVSPEQRTSNHDEYYDEFGAPK